MLSTAQKARFDLVTSGHEFLTTFLPLRAPDSRWALERFVATLRERRVPVLDLEAILLRCLAVIDRSRRVPSAQLTSHYLSPRTSSVHPVERFVECAQLILRQRGIGAPAVQAAIELIDTSYPDSTLTQSKIADAVGMTSSALSAAFRRQIGVTVREYIKNVRLERAALLLSELRAQRIKDVWVGCGFNHASNFDHDFKRRFGVSPRHYRERHIHIPADQSVARLTGTTHSAVIEGQARLQVPVLVVDDDAASADTIARYLHAEGFDASTAHTGEIAILEAQRLSPRAILVDYHLPDINGIDCIRRLRDKTIACRAGIALFTADFDLYDELEMIHALEAVLLLKICDLDDISHTVSYLAYSDSSA